MHLLPLIPEFLVFKREGRTCLSHSYSGTIICVNLVNEDLPEDLEGKTDFVTISNLNYPRDIELFMISVYSDQPKKKLNKILDRAIVWYVVYTASAVFEKRNNRIEIQNDL